MKSFSSQKISSHILHEYAIINVKCYNILPSVSVDTINNSSVDNISELAVNYKKRQ